MRPSIGTLVSAVVISLLGSASTLSAQTVTCQTANANNAECSMVMPAITIQIPRTVRIAVAGSTNFSLVPGSALTRGDFEATYFDTPSAMQITVHANAPWTVNMRATSANFLGTCAAKLAGAIKWGATSGARTNVLTTSNVPVLSNPAVAGVTYEVYLRTALSWTGDAPATESNCSLPVAFTASSP